MRRFISKITLLCLICFGTQSLKAIDITEDLSINDSVVWNNTNEVYRISANIFIEEGAKLSIGPGVSVEFQGLWGFYLRGEIYLNGQFNQPVVIKGRDLGDGKHVAWQGIDLQRNFGKIRMNYAIINDARTALKLSNVWNLNESAEFEMDLRNTTLENNQIGIIINSGGANMSLSNCLIANNDYGITTNTIDVDSAYKLGQMYLYNSNIENNTYGITGVAGKISNCRFTSNDTALWGVSYVQLDSNNFVSNQTAIIGHSLQINSSSFVWNGLAIHFTGKEYPNTPAQITSNLIANYFEANTNAVKIDEGHRSGVMQCNLYYRNDNALSLPSQVYISGNESFLLDRNAFAENGTGVMVVRQNSSFTPEAGTSLHLLDLRFNTWFANGTILTNASPENLNLLKNYMVGSKALIENTLIDGTDSTLYGLVNFTVSGDTSLIGGILTIEKIEDVIKHNNFDSTDTAGMVYSFNMCTQLPGNPLAINKAEPTLELLAYPNPTEGMLRVEWELDKVLEFHLYNALGQEFKLSNSTQESPAMFNLNEIPKGVYFLRAFDGVKVKTVRVVKE